MSKENSTPAVKTDDVFERGSVAAAYDETTPNPLIKPSGNGDAQNRKPQ
jgi:hypothetical protein